VIQCKSTESDPIDYGFRHCTVSIDIVVPFRNMSPIRPLAAGTTPSPRLRFLPFSQIIQLLRQLRCLVLQLACQLGRFPCHPAGLDRFANRVSKVGYGGDDTQSGTHKVTFPNTQTRRNQVAGRRRINETGGIYAGLNCFAGDLLLDRRYLLRDSPLFREGLLVLGIGGG